MSRLLAIDPGPVESAWVVIDTDTLWPESCGKEPNEVVRERIRRYWRMDLAIEMIASYGMPVGAEVFATCVEIGRFVQVRATVPGGAQMTPDAARLVYRADVKMHLCHNRAAKDSNIRQALVDRFALGQPNHGKGTTDHPGWFHGFSGDIWQSYALAVYAAETTSMVAP